MATVFRKIRCMDEVGLVSTMPIAFPKRCLVRAKSPKPPGIYVKSTVQRPSHQVALEAADAIATRTTTPERIMAKLEHVNASLH